RMRERKQPFRAPDAQLRRLGSDGGSEGLGRSHRLRGRCQESLQRGLLGRSARRGHRSCVSAQLLRRRRALLLSSRAASSACPSDDRGDNLCAAAERRAGMKTYVLVHGGGHGGWCYQPVARILRSKGHEGYAPSLTGLGDREHLLSPAVDLDVHITDIVKLLEFEDLRDVIVVGHSYGGMVITGIADRATDRVGHIC